MTVDYEKFVAKPEEKEIMGEKVTIHHLSVMKLNLFSHLGNDNKRQSATTEIILASLKDDKLTKEMVDSWKGGVRTTFLDMIMEVNGYGERLKDAEEKFIASASGKAGKEDRY